MGKYGSGIPLKASKLNNRNSIASRDSHAPHSFLFIRGVEFLLLPINQTREAEITVAGIVRQSRSQSTTVCSRGSAVISQSKSLVFDVIFLLMSLVTLCRCSSSSKLRGRCHVIHGEGESSLCLISARMVRGGARLHRIWRIRTLENC